MAADTVRMCLSSETGNSSVPAAFCQVYKTYRGPALCILASVILYLAAAALFNRSGLEFVNLSDTASVGSVPVGDPGYSIPDSERLGGSRVSADFQEAELIFADSGLEVLKAGTLMGMRKNLGPLPVGSYRIGVFVSTGQYAEHMRPWASADLEYALAWNDQVLEKGLINDLRVGKYVRGTGIVSEVDGESSLSFYLINQSSVVLDEALMGETLASLKYLSVRSAKEHVPGE